MALTLLEATVGVSILAVGVLAITSTALATDRIELEATDHDRARAAVTAVAERVRDTAREVGVWATTTEGSWASELIERLEATSTVPVADLVPWPAASGVVTIRPITDETVTDSELGVFVGMPRDLDLDGAIDANDVSASAVLLPVLVTARWQTDGIKRELVQPVLAGRY
ncbi:hypothetical protein Pla163_12330 [Planctomycetes bacterium Pla163]|uniref:Uncharacterized protein n=1 Tax=Rohdeia mirabilis TaxID=2528008 RepID=A0A518CY21_9BACT|nr:hypothetical protein Pla163_12330 [Planctomycetes bacterium Pla163]